MCNKDCFNCIYSDCINDRLDSEDFKRDFSDNDLLSHEKKLAKARNARYRERHRKELNRKSLAWNNANKERVTESTRKWQKQNRERINAMKRKRYAENPEYYRQKQNEYRQRKREEKLLNASCTCV